MTCTDTSKAKKAPPTKRQNQNSKAGESKKPAAKTSTSTSTTPAVGNTLGKSSTAGKRNNKMDYKDIIVGKVSGRKSTRKPMLANASASHLDKSEDLDALLPRIPPLSDVQVAKMSVVSKAARASINNANDQTLNATNSQSFDESEASEMGAVRSQLVHKFEGPLGTSNDANSNEKQESTKVTVDDQKENEKPSQGGGENDVIEIDLEEKKTVHSAKDEKGEAVQTDSDKNAKGGEDDVIEIAEAEMETKEGDEAMQTDSDKKMNPTEAEGGEDDVIEIDQEEKKIPKSTQDDETTDPTMPVETTDQANADQQATGTDDATAQPGNDEDGEAKPSSSSQTEGATEYSHLDSKLVFHLDCCLDFH